MCRDEAKTFYGENSSEHFKKNLRGFAGRTDIKAFYREQFYPYTILGNRLRVDEVGSLFCSENEAKFSSSTEKARRKVQNLNPPPRKALYIKRFRDRKIYRYSIVNVSTIEYRCDYWGLTPKRFCY